MKHPGLKTLLVAAACSITEPALGQEQLISSPTPSSPESKSNSLDLEEIIAQIDCSIKSTLDGIELTDNDLLKILKCNEINKVNLLVNETTILIEVELASGQTLEHEVLFSFGQDIQRYLLNRGVNVKTILEEPVFLRYVLMPLLTFAVIAVLSGPRFTNFFRKRRKQKTQKKESQNVNLPIEESTVKFDDIGGLKSVKADLMALVSDIKIRKTILEMGGKVPRGVLFMGPTGTGKTLAARAIAGEAGIPFIAIAGSEMLKKWIGDSAAES